MAITFDDTTVAAIPGEVQVEKAQFFEYYEVTGAARLFYSMLFNLSLKRLNSFFSRNALVQKWIALNEQFQFGCANPSIMINKSKGIYATYTDLTNDGGDSTPVIKIVQNNNVAFQKLELNEKDEFVTVSLYYRELDNLNARAWVDFNPLIPHLFSDNSSSIAAIKSEIKSEAWKCLELGLKQVEDVETPGLHHLQLPQKLTGAAY